MMRPYRVAIPQKSLDDLTARLARTRLTRPLPGRGLGVPVDRVRQLVRYWRDGYDWRAWERRINSHPQFMTELDGLDVHFLHIRSPRPDALPLILTHGWPLSVVEFLPLIERLSDAFHLVIPSVPGSGFSAVPQEPGWNRRKDRRCPRPGHPDLYVPDSRTCTSRTARLRTSGTAWLPTSGTARLVRPGPPGSVTPSAQAS
ncbi:epoxide hydrolase N-terminal domain-containing protein [Streptomyces sp. NPDC051018]|uniref:epoxide hydrolase N-terminal domain-containing protein n=1 Tax=Streptomyces sp. NPDC051018 TaxID=3365639 RepID=UPI0037BD6D2E